jgi:phytoene dehydrogenase-like protein
MSSATDVVVIGAGQSGLAAARTLQVRGISPVVLEAGDRAAGSWPCYYDSLKAFSPAGFNAMPGMPFPGDPDRYPARDEVADYLESYAAALDVEIRTGTRVVTIGREDGGFVVVTADGRRLRAAGIVAASGSFSAPHRPAFPGQESFTGELTQVAAHHRPRHPADTRLDHRRGGIRTAGWADRSADRGRQQASHAFECGGHQAVIDPGAAPLAGDDPGLAQHLQVVADGGLGQVERGSQVAHADLTALMGADEGQQPQADRVTKGLEHLRQPRRRGLTDRLADQRD